MTARVEAAAVSSKRAPSAAARTGNAVVAMGTASTAYGTKNICQPKLYRTSAPWPSWPLARTMTATTEASCAIRAISPTAARPRIRGATPAGKRRVGRSRSRSRSAGNRAVRTSAATPAVVPRDSISSAEPGQRRQPPVPLAEGDEREVGGDDHHAGQDRRQGGGGEPPVRLQDPVQHHGQPVEQDLRGEHHQHPGADRHDGRVRAAGCAREEQRGQRARGHRDDHADRGEQQDRPGQRRGRDLAGLGLAAGPGSGVPCPAAGPPARPARGSGRWSGRRPGRRRR